MVDSYVDFFIEHLPTVKSASAAEKSAREQCVQLMDQIYKENPEYWPNGLDITPDHEVFMVRSASTKEPAGFVGWQERNRDNRRVGYYTVGILPAFRGEGFAKEAVAKIIDMKSQGVDCVRAYIAPSNAPSHRLAASLNVDVEKSASVAEGAGKFLTGKLMAGMGATGLGTAAAWDWQQHPESKLPFQGEWNRGRGFTAMINGILGAAAPILWKSKHPWLALESPTVAPVTKDLLAGLLPAAQKTNQVVDKFLEPAPAKESILSNPSFLGAMGGAGLLGGAAIMASKRMGGKADAFQNGKVQLRLPTKDPNDIETMVEMPIDKVNLSPNQIMSISRDLRRKLRQESKERIWRRGPKGRPITRYEEGDDIQEAELVGDVKAASDCYESLPFTERMEILMDYKP